MFIKQNYSPLKDILIKEVEGLKHLREILENNPYLRIPKVYLVDEKQLKIQKIQSQRPSQQQMKNLGEGLALMHQKIHDQFGFYHDNYIGLSKQHNILSDDWGAFFIEYRLGFQVSLIKDKSVQKGFHDILQYNANKLIDFLNQNCPHSCLIHGDLWSGNVLFDVHDIWLIDPAVYYGDREADVAMTEMFGGFSQNFYNTYREIYPLTSHYDRKKVIYNLYHYLNHYNLFGGYYFSACQHGFGFIQSMKS